MLMKTKKLSLSCMLHLISAFPLNTLAPFASIPLFRSPLLASFSDHQSSLSITADLQNAFSLKALNPKPATLYIILRGGARFNRREGSM